MKAAVLYVMFEEYDFLEREIALLNDQTRLDFTLVCVTGFSVKEDRLREVLAKAKFPTVALRRSGDNGPAGGFYDGQCWCLEQGFDVVIHVESDCFPTSADLMDALLGAAETHPVVIPMCMPEKLPMGWRFCAVSADALRRAGLSYKSLYFITEDVYFVRNLARAYPPHVLEDVHVYHAPVIGKATNYDKLLAPFPYLMSRNHMLYNLRLIRRHHALGDVLNLAGYIVCHVVFALHLRVRGKAGSAALMMQGLLDGLFGREDRLLKDRMQETPDDERVEPIESFTPDVVLDKQDVVRVPDVLRALGAVRKRVLIQRSALFLTLVVYYLSRSLAATDGTTTWIIKRRPHESALALLLFFVVFPVAAVLAFPLIGIGVLAQRVPAIEQPGPSGLAPMQLGAGT